uniref:Legume lectin domain-containing protein n=3 Tax=Setaria TaxID=4554 RepID=A0A341LLH0_SETIT
MALRLAAHPFVSCSAVFLLLVAHALAQPAPAPDAGCNGILLTYTLQGRDKIRPFVPNPDSQPYAFRANATVRNAGTRPLRSWALLLTFVHGEILVGVDGAVLTSGADLPYNTTADAGNA